jgi:HEAT repeat protein
VDSPVVALIVLAAGAYALLLAVGGWHLFLSGEQRERRDANVVAATARHLEFTGGKAAAFGDPRVISGVRGGYRVTISVAGRDSSGAVNPEIVVAAPDGEALLPQPLALPGLYSPGIDGVESDWAESVIGDPPFDRHFRLRDLTAASLAALDAATRDLLVSAAARRMSFHIANGRQILVLPAVELTAARFAAWVDDALQLAARVAATAVDIPAALARNAREDHAVTVRLLNLAALAAEHPSLPLTGETLRELRAGSNPAARCLAAILSGEEGFEPLLDSLRQPGIDGDLFGRALVHLVSTFPVERVRPVIQGLLEGGPETRRQAALQAILDAGSPAWEQVALGALALEEPEARRTAIRALARIGTITSVPRLRAIARDEPLDRLQSAAAAAIAQIQARLEGAAAGQVMLADTTPAAGRVSLAGNEGGGRLVLAGPEPAHHRLDSPPAGTGS